MPPDYMDEIYLNTYSAGYGEEYQLQFAAFTGSPSDALSSTSLPDPLPPIGSFLGGSNRSQLFGSQLVVQVTSYAPRSVPEPSALASAGIAGLVGLGLAWRRRKGAKVTA